MDLLLPGGKGGLEHLVDLAIGAWGEGWQGGGYIWKIQNPRNRLDKCLEGLSKPERTLGRPTFKLVGVVGGELLQLLGLEVELAGEAVVVVVQEGGGVVVVVGRSQRRQHATVVPIDPLIGHSLAVEALCISTN